MAGVQKSGFKTTLPYPPYDPDIEKVEDTQHRPVPARSPAPRPWLRIRRLTDPPGWSIVWRNNEALPWAVTLKRIVAHGRDLTSSPRYLTFGHRPSTD